ncbi:AMP-binding protein [Halodurantibacterium flavum]|uniref:AMP-binding protein n=1 Tax=Halodurantibacterium flavum TaxID=1382802 RepID=A0ABW4RZD1_9RHOB
MSENVTATRSAASSEVTGTAGGPGLAEITVGEALRLQAEARGDAPALIYGEAMLDYATLDRQVDLLARALIGLGTQPGDHVAVMAPNSVEWVLLEYALARIGAVMVTVNPAFRSQELAYLLRQGRVSTLLTVRAHRRAEIAADLAALLPDLAGADPVRGRRGEAFPDLRHVVMLDDADLPGALTFTALLSLAEAVPRAQLAARAAAVKPGDVMQVQYTSGTTGAPKGAMLTHRGCYNNARLMAARGGFGPDDRLLSAMPLFHTAGCVCNVLGMLAVGGCLILLPEFEPGAMMSAAEAHGATIINAVPTMYRRMLDHPDAGTRGMSALRIAFTGGTSIPPALMLELRQRFGAEPMIIMGMTECSPIITQTDPSDDLETRCATAGTPLPHVEVRIADPETGTPMDHGQPGELLIRGFGVMRGYFDMPDRTAETIDAAGWLHSGDLAVLAPSGHLRIVGRLKDMLIRGGENVYPVEIEEALMTHPDIAEAQVVGVPDPDLGEEIFAFLIPTPGARLDPAAVQDWCKASFARHKTPRYIRVLDSLPLTANGKVQKFELRRMAAEAVAAGE